MKSSPITIQESNWKNAKMDSFMEYTFDEALIATAPMPNRDQSRLLIYHRETRTILHQQFSSIIDFLTPNDLVVVNDTRVFWARLPARKRSGGEVELLLLRPMSGSVEGGPKGHRWEALMKGRGLPGDLLALQGGGEAKLISELGQGRKEVALFLPEGTDFYAYLAKWGEVPVPPYILRRRIAEGVTEHRDAEQYQTVYAKAVGSAAAPTAGLHFTEQLMTDLVRKGVGIATITLHIGTDTFRPIEADRLSDHKMYGEWAIVSEETADAARKTRARNGKVVAVGTSVTRTLEFSAANDGAVSAMEGEVSLFITPGYRFRVVDTLVTNFHPPRSTGLVLVSAFGGGGISALYQEALEKRYRLFSYGDAMLVL
jgi:S-adenosylmethionine:tRNA ribosyltransferase-isomerase